MAMKMHGVARLVIGVHNDAHRAITAKVVHIPHRIDQSRVIAPTCQKKKRLIVIGLLGNVI
jgi:hypothetical protein